MSRIVAAMLLMSWCLNVFAFGESFGSPGEGGYSGVGGVSGNAGEDVSIIVDGRALELRLDGQDGTPGSDATNGESASGCYHSTGVGHRWGAAGGSGGHGGDGGHGGRGGNAIFFIKKFTDLSGIFLTQQGGKGAPGGKAGLGGSGCGCSPSSWQAQTCDTRRVCSSSGGCSTSQTCTMRTFNCNPGQNGYNGNPGAAGASGEMGTIQIVKDLTQLPEEKPAAEISLLSLKQKPLGLSKLIWEEKTGAKKLFAQGSNVQDKYSLYVKKAERTLVLDWKVKREFADFQHEKFQVNFDGQKFTLKYLGEQFLKTKLIEGESTTVVLVEEAYRQEDILLLSTAGIEGSAEATTISLKDISGLGHLIKSTVSLSFSYKHWLKGWVEVFDDVVPASAIVSDINGLQIQVGKLDLKDKALKKGAKVRYTLKIKRQLESLEREVALPQQEDTL